MAHMLYDCRVAAKTAAEQGGERLPNGTDLALPPPPPKPQPSDKGEARSRVHGDVAGQSLHACIYGLLLCVVAA